METTNNEKMEREEKIRRLQENLPFIRRLAAWTIGDLSDKIGVTAQTVRNMEKADNQSILGFVGLSKKQSLNYTQYIAIRTVLDEETAADRQNIFLKVFVSLLLDNRELKNEDYKKIQIAENAALSMAGESDITFFLNLFYRTLSFMVNEREFNKQFEEKSDGDEFVYAIEKDMWKLLKNTLELFPYLEISKMFSLIVLTTDNNSLMISAAVRQTSGIKTAKGKSSNKNTPKNGKEDIEERNKRIARLQENLSSLRVIAGMTMERLGESIGVSKQTISNLERSNGQAMSCPQYIAIKTVFEQEAALDPKKSFLLEALAAILYVSPAFDRALDHWAGNVFYEADKNALKLAALECNGSAEEAKKLFEHYQRTFTENVVDKPKSLLGKLSCKISTGLPLKKEDAAERPAPKEWL